VCFNSKLATSDSKLNIIPAGKPNTLGFKMATALTGRPLARELAVFAGFVGLTALMTWPWVLHLRDAVADRGDPYMIAWSLWWDYHQTFNDPLRLFHANVFYPYQYTLAFSENDYGIALLFFPLFALGVRPLTVHSVATFLGFAFSGYGMFRLARTLTGSSGAGWVAGVAFAFVPFRFHALAHLHYLFAGWLPLVLEALVLFARRRSWRRAAWLGVAFLMNALTCITWFIMALVPLGLVGLFYLWREPGLRRERAFWLRSAVALGAASLALLPFLLPYYWVSEMYGLKWQPWEFAHNSPTLMHWVAAEGRTKLYARMGAHVGGGHRLFPGLLAPLLALAALRFGRRVEDRRVSNRRPLWLGALLEVLILVAALVAVLALGYEDVSLRVLGVQLLRTGHETPGLALWLIVALLAARVGLALWGRGREPNAARGEWRAGEALGVGLIWAAWGFISSLGANVFLNRWLHEHVFLFQSLRIPSRWAMICYVGLSLLAGVGALALAGRLRVPGSGLRGEGRLLTRNLVFVLVVAALLFELRAFPLEFDRGEAEPDAVTLRLKETPMRGGLVELPSEVGVERHRYMLRAADHGRPLVNATASFISPLTFEINRATRDGALRGDFLDLLEDIPASYLVVHHAAVPPDQRAGYEDFLARGVASGRLRFVNRFDGRDDLYAVVKTEPDARSEAPLPFALDERDWAALVAEDPVNLLGPNQAASARLYRLHLAAAGRLPRYDEFVADAREVGRGILPAFESEAGLERAFRAFAARFAARPAFAERFAGLDDEQYVARLFEHAGLADAADARAALAAELRDRRLDRPGALLRVADDPRLAERERHRSLVLLHFFAYLRRNPEDSPDGNIRGLLHWVGHLDQTGDTGTLSLAFMNSLEYKARAGGR